VKLKILDLFSGIGGFSLGLEATGHFETAAFCEIEPYCQKVLKKHWPDVPIFDDIRKLKGTDIGTIDIITGGYPCQPFSVAGKQKAEQDPRHLWPEYFRLIQELQPTWVIGENVSGHIKLGLDSVLEDLASEGYSSRTFSISAASIGANHKRERIWTVAYTRRSFGREQSSRYKKSSGLWSFEKTKWSTDTSEVTRSSERTETVANTTGDRWNESKSNKISQSTIRESQEGGMLQSERTSNVENSSNKSINSFSNSSEERQKGLGGKWWESEPRVGRVAHGIPKRVDRLKTLGNAVVPHIPYYIGQAIVESYQ